MTVAFINLSGGLVETDGLGFEVELGVDGVVGAVFGDDLFHFFDEGEVVAFDDEGGEFVEEC